MPNSKYDISCGLHVNFVVYNVLEIQMYCYKCLWDDTMLRLANSALLIT